jgi:hypothetical protein
MPPSQAKILAAVEMCKSELSACEVYNSGISQGFEIANQIFKAAFRKLTTAVAAEFEEFTPSEGCFPRYRKKSNEHVFRWDSDLDSIGHCITCKMNHHMPMAFEEAVRWPEITREQAEELLK